MNRLAMSAIALLASLSAGTAGAQTSHTPAQKAEVNKVCDEGPVLRCLDKMIANATEQGDEQAVKVITLMRMATAYSAEKAEQEAAKALARAQRPGPAEVPMTCSGRMTRDGCQPR